jgi:glycosyltransferase involved in cell wall biosynthesis
LISIILYFLLMHFLHLPQLYHNASGAARYFIEVGERLVADGHRVTVVTSNAFDLEHFWAAGKRTINESRSSHNGVEVIRLPVQRAPGPPIVYPILRRLMLETGRLPGSGPLLRRMATLTPRLRGLNALLASAELADVDLVHTTNITLDFAIIPVVAWARRRGVPHLVTPFVHLGEPDKPTIVRYYTMPHMLDIMRGSAAVVTQTELERTFLGAKGVPARLMHTIGVGVTPGEHTGGDGARFRSSHTIAGPLVLTIGAAAFDKGTIHVVEAMQRLWAAGSNATWVQIGPQLEHFRQFAAELAPQYKANTRILGFVDDHVRRDALAAADLLVMPSRTDSFGIAYLEAWCNDLPVIGARAGGVPEIVRDGENGLLVEFGAVADLAEAIERLLGDRDLAKKLGQAGHKRVLRELTWEAKYAQVSALYRAITA